MNRVFPILLSLLLSFAVTNAQDQTLVWTPRPLPFTPAPQLPRTCRHFCSYEYRQCIKQHPTSVRKCRQQYSYCWRKCSCEDKCLETFKNCRSRPAPGPHLVCVCYKLPCDCGFSCPSVLCKCVKGCTVQRKNALILEPSPITSE